MKNIRICIIFKKLRKLKKKKINIFSIGENIKNNFLIVYSVFLFLNLFSISIIRIIMISLFLNVIRKSKRLKRDLILIVRTASLVGSVLIVLFFQILVLDISSTQQWNKFFFFGWFFSLFLIILTLILNSKIKLNQNHIQEKIETNDSENSFVQGEKSFKQLFILYIACFLATSDLLFMLLMSSFIYNKFGEVSWRIFTSLSFMFMIGVFLGNLLAHNLSDKIKKEKVFLIGVSSYLFLMFLLTFSDFFVLVLLYFSLSVFGSLCNFTYTSYVAEYSKNLKNKTFKYQLLHSYYSLAQFLFVPLGYYLYASLSIESIIIISCFFFIISIILISYCILYEGIEKRKRI